jgi:hypothetical protein
MFQMGGGGLLLSGFPCKEGSIRIDDRTRANLGSRRNSLEPAILAALSDKCGPHFAKVAHWLGLDGSE